MKIDLPIVIVFNANGITQRDLDNCSSAKVCTLRFDTEDYNVPGQLFDHYPPRDGAEKLAEPGDPILTVLSERALASIRTKAKRDPYDYMVGDEAERTAAQEMADALRAEDGP